MATAFKVLAPLQGALVPVPAEQPGVCPLCRTGVGEGYSRCYSCNQASRVLGQLQPALPMALSAHNLQLHYALNQYKRSVDVAVRSRLALQLAGLVVTFLARHGRCLAEWDVIVPVPSPRGTALDEVLNKTQYRASVVHALTATRDSADRPIDRTRFRVEGLDDGVRVLLIDDTFTTGASLFSARAALEAADVAVADAVVLGRHIHPSSWPPSQELMSWLGSRSWSPDHCGRCNGEWRTAPSLF